MVFVPHRHLTAVVREVAGLSVRLMLENGIPISLHRRDIQFLDRPQKVRQRMAQQEQNAAETIIRLMVRGTGESPRVAAIALRGDVVYTQTHLTGDVDWNVVVANAIAGLDTADSADPQTLQSTRQAVWQPATISQATKKPAQKHYAGYDNWQPDDTEWGFNHASYVSPQLATKQTPIVIVPIRPVATKTVQKALF